MFSIFASHFFCSVAPFQISKLPLLQYPRISLEPSLGKTNLERKQLQELLHLYGTIPSQNASSLPVSKVSKSFFDTTLLPLISRFENTIQQMKVVPFSWQKHPFVGKYFIVQYEMNQDIQHFVTSFVTAGKGTIVSLQMLLPLLKQKVVVQEQVVCISPFLPMELSDEQASKYQFSYRNAQFLEDCLHQQKWIEISRSSPDQFYLYHSLPPLPYEPFLKEQITLTNFRENDKMDYTSLLYFLGANATPMLHKETTTTLVFVESERESEKIKHAKQWNIPMQTKQWLLEHVSEWFDKFFEQFPKSKKWVHFTS